jgi:hypothetical protein
MGAPTREANPPSPELLRGGDHREATDRTAQEPDQPRTSTPSLFYFLLRSASPFVEPVTTILLPFFDHNRAFHLILYLLDEMLGRRCGAEQPPCTATPRPLHR